MSCAAGCCAPEADAGADEAKVHRDQVEAAIPVPAGPAIQAPPDMTQPRMQVAMGVFARIMDTERALCVSRVQPDGSIAGDVKEVDMHPSVEQLLRVCCVTIGRFIQGKPLDDSGDSVSPAGCTDTFPVD